MKNLKVSNANHAYINALAVVKFNGNTDTLLAALIKIYEDVNPDIAIDVKNYLQLQKVVKDQKLKYER